MSRRRPYSPEARAKLIDLIERAHEDPAVKMTMGERKLLMNCFYSLDDRDQFGDLIHAVYVFNGWPPESYKGFEINHSKPVVQPK